jgi:hypothetical protein
VTYINSGRKKCDGVLEKKTNKQHRDKEDDRLQVIVRARNQGWTSKIRKAVHTSKLSKKRVSSCPELCKHGTGQQTGIG